MITRRTFTLASVAAAAAPASVLAEQQAGGASAQRLRTMVELPVNEPWLILGQSTYESVSRVMAQRYSDTQPPTQITSGASPIAPGGQFLTAAQPLGDAFIPGERALRILEVTFDSHKKLVLVRKFFDRGWNDANIPTWTSFVDGRYSGYARGERIGLSSGDTDDYSILYPIGRFVVELEIPEHGTLATAIYATRGIHETMHQLDGTYERLQSFYEQHQATT